MGEKDGDSLTCFTRVEALNFNRKWRPRYLRFHFLHFPPGMNAFLLHCCLASFALGSGPRQEPVAAQESPPPFTEVDAARAFQAMDRNGDGVVQSSESLPPTKPSQAPAEKAAKAPLWFQQMDRNGNDRVDYLEFLAAAGSRWQRAGLALEPTLKQTVSRLQGAWSEELQNSFPKEADLALGLCRLESLDHDKDGTVAPAEPDSTLSGNGPWLGMDRNQDGRLSAAEFQAYQRSLRARFLLGLKPPAAAPQKP